MKYKLIIKEPVNIEISEAFLYYELQQNKLGYKLLESIEKALNEISLHPLTYQTKLDVFSTINVKPFPFVLVFEVLKNEVIVYQFFNAKQNPKKRAKKGKK